MCEGHMGNIVRVRPIYEREDGVCVVSWLERTEEGQLILCREQFDAFSDAEMYVDRLNYEMA